ncbi:MAG: hypothetical protein IKB75_05390 [Clostridia bacterium]|nr:hypothetical protein [Clostridia bacterium]
MGDFIVGLLLYYLKLLAMTLGPIVVCGLAVELLSRAFARLVGFGSGIVFGVTAAIGTPIHELGHAAMCLLFGHKIVDMKLWSPTAQDGLYGYVQHSYNRKNVWARFGNLFIGVGPIFSGLGVVVLMLWLCFPTSWHAFLENSQALAATDIGFVSLLKGIFSLFLNLPAAFAEHWFVSTLGLIVILSVSLHITLSLLDIKGALSALPIYCGLFFVFALITFTARLNAPIEGWFWLLTVRLLSLFSVVIAFCLLWVLVGVIIRLFRSVFKAF